MKIMRTFIMLFFVTTSFCTCKKSVDCPKTNTLTITGANTITQGWDVYLSFGTAISSLRFVASGPNGWSEEFTGRQIIKRNMQMQDAGIYYIRAYNSNNCVELEGSHTVAVTAIENAPCQGTIANNTSTTDFAGLNSFAYSSVTFIPNIANNYSTVMANTAAPVPANTYFAVGFGGTIKPKPGKYRTVYSYTPGGSDDLVAVHFNDGSTNKLYLSAEGQYVYVTLVNGKTQICFCNIAVSYTISGTPNYVSGKITID